MSRALSQPRLELLRSLRGQVVRYPNLRDLFRSWPEATNNNISNVRQETANYLEA